MISLGVPTNDGAHAGCNAPTSDGGIARGPTTVIPQHASSVALDWRLALLLALGIGDEQAEWQEWTDCDVLVVHDIFLGQRQAVHDRVRLGDVPSVQQEDGAAAIAARIPFT